MRSNINFPITALRGLLINLSKKGPSLQLGRVIAGLLAVCLLSAALPAKAQNPMDRFRGMGGGSKGSDTALRHRTEDTIVINYRFLDSSRLRKLDSSVYDWTQKYPIPNSYINLGNFGNAAKSLIFYPTMRSGWDPGWHSYDIYAFNTDETRFFNTTKPYTELGYSLGSKAEQMIGLTHTQNVTKNLNLALQYRLINAPGAMQNQTTNHNGYRFSGWYQSKNKRYQAFLVLVGNKLQSGENGGLRNPDDLNSLTYSSSKFNIPTRLGPYQAFSTNPFSVNIPTGTFYNNGFYTLRQQYDIIGKKDSIVTDSAVIPLFYPKFRAEHTIQYSVFRYRFIDNAPDTFFYVQNYNFVSWPDTLILQDKWRQLINDISLSEFPQSKNPQQFLKAGISLQNLRGFFDAGTKTFYNVFVHGEYRNRTRNQKWDIEAFGKIYLNGFNAGDYDASISMKRQISRTLGSLELGFQNVNRTPSFAFDQESSFGFGVPGFFKKENSTNLFGFFELPSRQLRMGINYYLINNYSYFYDYYHAGQVTNPFNIVQLSVDKVFRLRRHWVWRMSLVLQQKAGSSPINIPLFYTHNLFAYEGNLGFRNLNLATGVDLRYYTGYKADGYSPMIGQFFVQSDTTLRLRLPDISIYANFRIRSFTAYARLENLNTFQFSGPGGLGFNNYNFVAPNYPSAGLRLRIGIFWSFVN
jgi:hypothetical protein